MEVSEWIKQYAEAQKAEHGTYQEFGATYIGPDLRGTPEHKSFRQLIGILPAAIQKEIINMTRWDKVPPQEPAAVLAKIAHSIGGAGLSFDKGGFPDFESYAAAHHRLVGLYQGVIDVFGEQPDYPRNKFDGYLESYPEYKPR
ncbi:MAG: hypothetical protein KGI37_01660 [Alphaproteobacteria bacterium]|nr:hypothetical protein [Alphaproteobacteria bacterium]